MRFNKNIQKRLDISINDYKEYSQIHSSIEVEIKFDDDKYGEFINIKNEERKYFLIYFTYYNNSKEEINRNILKMNEKVKMINVIINEKIISFINLFRDFKNISSIKFKKFARNNIRDMSFMFDKCESLKELNLNSFNTSNVTDMLSMFSGCSKLKELNLSKFDTSNVTTMDNMFSECSSLNKLDFSSFNTNKVTKMRWMFYECSSLKKLNISSFNTTNIIDMSNMFDGCKSLENLNLSNLILIM